MNSGELRHTITFEQRQASTLPNGEPAAPAWAYFDYDYAALRTPTAKEIAKAQELSHVASITVRMRYRGDITSDMRIKLENPISWALPSRYLEILAVYDPDFRAKELHLLCREAT